MTREEAIKQLQQIIDVAHMFERNEKEIDALDEEAILLAIKALESMPEMTVFRSGQIDTTAKDSESEE